MVDAAHETGIAEMRRRISRTNKLHWFFTLLMPLGFVIPCAGAIASIPWNDPQPPQGFTVSQGFGMAAFALPIIGLAGWFLMGSDRKKYRRSLAVLQFAEQMGFRFSEKADNDLLAFLKSFGMFSDADQHGGFNCIYGSSKNRDVVVLDYSTVYRGIGPSSIKINNQTVVVVNDLPGNVPNFTTGPKTWLDKVYRVLGAKHVELSDNANFNKRFVICAEDSAAVTKCFTPNAAEIIATRGATSEVHDGAVVFYRHNQLVDPKNYRQFIDSALAFCNEIDGTRRAT